MSIIQKLERASIFSISVPQQGVYEFTEGCDNYYSLQLTAFQVLELAEELQEFVKAQNPDLKK